MFRALLAHHQGAHSCINTIVHFCWIVIVELQGTEWTMLNPELFLNRVSCFKSSHILWNLIICTFH